MKTPDTRMQILSYDRTGTLGWIKSRTGVLDDAQYTAILLHNHTNPHEFIPAAAIAVNDGIGQSLAQRKVNSVEALRAALFQNQVSNLSDRTLDHTNV